MTSTQQRAELQRQIWHVANYVRGSVDVWNFKQYVLGTLFYRFISENFAVNILVLFKHKTENKTQFIDASKLFKKDDVGYFAQSIDYDAIAKNDYNLSVSAYVEPEDTREVIDITKLNTELKTTVTKIDKLRSDIDTIVEEIEANT